MVKSAVVKKPRVHKAVEPELPTEETAEQSASPTVDRETFHFHMGRIMRQQSSVDAARKALKTLRRDAQDAGIVLKDLDTIMRMREEEPETVQAGIQRLATYANWAGLAPGVQGDLFEHQAKRMSAVKRAEDEGYVDGLEGKTAEGDRYDTASEVGQARLKGWQRGQEVIHKRFLDKNANTAGSEAVN